jgi:PHD/YefM family antitoxin component YafN of YafNO toxin-antitoxin module
MGTVKVGIREFRDNLASYLLQSESPVAITRHGDTVGFYIPARRKRTDAEREAFRAAGERVDKMMAELGITEEEVLEDFKAFRAEERRSKITK